MRKGGRLSEGVEPVMGCRGVLSGYGRGLGVGGEEKFRGHQSRVARIVFIIFVAGYLGTWGLNQQPKPK